MHEAHVGFVGKSKVHHGEGSLPMDSSAIPPPTKNAFARTTAQQLYFQLKEFDEFRQPSFNVLYVQTPRPSIMKHPWMEALSLTISETAELLSPLLRLGVPPNSLRDKLPYFREDYSPLPNTVRPRVQKLLKANIQFAERQAALGAQAAEEWQRMKRERKDAKRGNSKQGIPQTPPLALLLSAQQAQHHPHIPHPHFYTHEMPAWVVPMLNLAAYYYICGLQGVLGGMWWKQR